MAAATTTPSIVLSHRPGEWEGTFLVLLKALLEDLAVDGEGNCVTVTYDYDGKHRTIIGSLVGVDPGDGRFRDAVIHVQEDGELPLIIDVQDIKTIGLN